MENYSHVEEKDITKVFITKHNADLNSDLTNKNILTAANENFATGFKEFLTSESRSRRNLMYSMILFQMQAAIDLKHHSWIL